MVFCWDEGELVLCGRMVQGRWGCWEDECWGLFLGIWGGGGGRKFVRRYEVEKRICVFYLEGGWKRNAYTFASE